eukprot:7347938-Prymnesium_polylepis.1
MTRGECSARFAACPRRGCPGRTGPVSFRVGGGGRRRSTRPRCGATRCGTARRRRRAVRRGARLAA